MRDASDSVRDLSRPASERHVPVLLTECLDMLAPAIDRPGAVLVDGTLGMGGHTEGALERFENLTVIGIDRDPQAIELASARLERFGTRFRAVHTTYDNIDEAVEDQLGQGARVDGILMDLGVSSLQLDEAERGFAYSKDAPLDMRMDSTTGPSAADLLATASEGELIRILRTTAKRNLRRVSLGSSSVAAILRRSRVPGSSWTLSARRSPPPRGAPAVTLPSAPSRRCAAPSTTS